MLKILTNLPRWQKRILVVATDVCLISISIWLAHCIRIEEIVVLQNHHYYMIIGAVAFSIPIFISFGMYRAIFRYSGTKTLIRVIKAVSVYSFFSVTFITVVSIPRIPRSVGIIHPILLFIFIASSRGMARYWLGGVYKDTRGRSLRRNVLIYGAGAAGRKLASAFETNSEYELTGFIDDDNLLVGNTINTWRIFSSKGLISIIEKYKIQDIFLALPSLNRKDRNKIIKDLQQYPVHIRTLPDLSDLASGRVSINDIKELDIEDLLGREPVEPNENLISNFIGAKIILVTGAGGSIGSEICRQVLKYNPVRIILIEHNEYSLYSIIQELEKFILHEKKTIGVTPYLTSIKDKKRIIRIFNQEKPEIVFHAAAYKHVPLIELNVAESITNNIIGTLNLVEAAEKSCVKQFVLISTDKAVRPTNIMGASKRVSELILQAYAKRKKTCFSMVRFGNVLGSSGSVVPLFRQQIRSGGPVTVTDINVNRYFMTIPEAVQLVIQAGAMAIGGEVFLLDMGEPVRIYELAKKMIELSGFTLKSESNPDGDIEIILTGLRSGEKLYEELIIGKDSQKTEHPRIMKAKEVMINLEKLLENIFLLAKFSESNNLHGINGIFKKLVDGYKPSKKSIDLLHL